MQLIINNPNGIIESAFFEEKKYSLNLIINTVDKWVNHDFCMTGHLSDEIKALDGNERRALFSDNPPIYRALQYQYIKDNDPRQLDSVILKAENTSEESVLMRRRFDQLEKDQLHILLLHDDVFTLEAETKKDEAQNSSKAQLSM